MEAKIKTPFIVSGYVSGNGHIFASFLDLKIVAIKQNIYLFYYET